MRLLIKWLFVAIALPLLPVVAFLVFAIVGGVIPASLSQSDHVDGGETITIYLTANLLHTDIALPVTPRTREVFGFLEASDFPYHNPNLRYFVIGWGSKAFYTETRDYADMRLETIWTAVTGDNSVMHVGPAGNLTPSDDVIPVKLDPQQFDQLLAFTKQQFKLNADQPQLIEGANFGFGDVFYEAEGNFNLLYPCNMWVSKAMRTAGLASGVWTPTTYSLLLNHYLYN